MWELVILVDAREEFNAMPQRERNAMANALAKLSLYGDQLAAPHSSNVEGTSAYLRELRPRGGASPWRGLYRRIGNEIVIGAISPEALKDRKGFNRAVENAIERLDAYARGDTK